MDHDLQRYLNDHLAGSNGALLLIQHFIDTMNESEARDDFILLKKSVENDRALLEHLIASAGLDTSAVANAAGDLAARVGFLKLMWEGFETGGLGLFEGLEMLALGIQGKSLLWLSLREISSWYPEWNEVDFSKLEMDAIEQRDSVEFWRIEAARDILPSVERRAAATVATTA
ncbi:MAG: hypothetical protein V4689_22405 [Verrucomicrobiota bacterium]